MQRVQTNKLKGLFTRIYLPLLGAATWFGLVSLCSNLSIARSCGSLLQSQISGEVSVETGEIYEIIFQPKGKCRKKNFFLSDNRRKLKNKDSIYSYRFSEHIAMCCLLLEAFLPLTIPFPIFFPAESLHSPCFCRIAQTLNLKCHMAWNYLFLNLPHRLSPPASNKEEF